MLEWVFEHDLEMMFRYFIIFYKVKYLRLYRLRDKWTTNASMEKDLKPPDRQALVNSVMLNHCNIAPEVLHAKHPLLKLLPI